MLPVADVRLAGDLSVPPAARGLVVFAHGILPGAGHLFEEPGALEKVAALARDWFLAHL